VGGNVEVVVLVVVVELVLEVVLASVVTDGDTVLLTGVTVLVTVLALEHATSRTSIPARTITVNRRLRARPR
jgi:hypothetical protein